MTSKRAPETNLSREFLEALRPLLRRIRSERSLSPGKMGILYQLSVRGVASGAELAAAVRISPQAISLSTGELIELGWIQLAPTGEDRRRKNFELTDSGRTMLEQEIHAGEGWISSTVAQTLNQNEREVLAAAIPVLRKIGAEDLGD